MNERMRLADGAQEALVSLYQLAPDGEMSQRSIVLTVQPHLCAHGVEGEIVLDLSELAELPGELRSPQPAAVAVLTPSTADELSHTMETIAPQRVVLDSSLTLAPVISQWYPGRNERNRWVHRVVDGLPKEVRAVCEGPAALLLAWIARMPSVVRLTAMLPAEVVADNRFREVRGHVARRLRLCAALRLPRGLFPAVPVLQPGVLYFGGNRQQIYVDRVDELGEFANPTDEAWFQRLRLWLDEAEPYTPYMLPITADIPWKEQGGIDLQGMMERLARLGQLETLGALSTVIEGKRITRDEPDVPSGVPVLRRGHLVGGTINLGEARRVEASSIPEKYFLAPNDILVSTAVNDGSRAVLNRSSEKAVIEHGVAVIRVTDPRINPQYVLEYLNGATGRALMHALAGTNAYVGPRLSAAKLRGLPIPLLDHQLLEGLDEIGRTEAALREKADELRQQRLRLFDAPNADVFRRDVRDLKRRGHLFAGGIERADGIEYQIANFFPFPLAYTYRSIAGQHDVTDRYREQLHAAENLLAFLGSVALALVPVEKRANLDLRRFWRAGISPGDWKELLVRGVERIAEEESHSLAHALSELNVKSGKGFGGDLASLIWANNEFKHRRGPTTLAEKQGVVTELDDLLGRCMRQLAFFTDHPLRHLRRCDRTRRGGWSLSYTSYVGDHPAHTSGTERFTDASAAQFFPNELYVVVEQKTWVSLYPFISVHDCPHCGTREVYFIDKLNERKGSVTLKSFERGHTEQSQEIGSELLAWSPSANSLQPLAK